MHVVSRQTPSGVFDSTRHVRSQQPLVCSETHVPEPDFMVLRGTLSDYTDLPRASDAWCVVEAADASYERDVGEKLLGYALAGVSQYVVADVRAKEAEVFTEPDSTNGTYAARTVVSADQVLPLRVGETETRAVRLADLFACGASTNRLVLQRARRTNRS